VIGWNVPKPAVGGLHLTGNNRQQTTRTKKNAFGWVPLSIVIEASLPRTCKQCEFPDNPFLYDASQTKSTHNTSRQKKIRGESLITRALFIKRGGVMVVVGEDKERERKRERGSL
jgi:hypothetical protein